jgi:hypothetical protein
MTWQGEFGGRPGRVVSPEYQDPWVLGGLGNGFVVIQANIEDCIDTLILFHLII